MAEWIMAIFCITQGAVIGWLLAANTDLRHRNTRLQSRNVLAEAGRLHAVHGRDLYKTLAEKAVAAAKEH